MPRRVSHLPSFHSGNVSELKSQLKCFSCFYDTAVPWMTCGIFDDLLLTRLTVTSELVNDFNSLWGPCGDLDPLLCFFSN